jgi:hypothetical protein
MLTEIKGNEAAIYLKLTASGIESVRIGADNPEQHKSAHTLLGRVGFELMVLDRALKVQTEDATNENTDAELTSAQK